MTEPLILLLGIHHHQPVGNFDGVFTEAFAKCYRPLLDALEKHPGVKISLHHSGPLLDWALEREHGYLERVTALVEKGQIEIMGGGFYEPILTILKPSDALGQIEMMQSFWEKRTGKRPKGMWLAERVWEPSIASTMAAAGMTYTVLDDQHFRHAGVTNETLIDYYRTERAGNAISIFPTDKTLRYIIPFREPKDVINHLLSLQERYPGHAVTYGDDGEKFGMWPGTYKWVIEQGWLNNFLDALEANKSRIRTMTFSEFMKDHGPSGTIYLPTASYSEMLEWAMPADAILRYEAAKKKMEHSGVWDMAEPFFRGGFWDNFLTKYPESNLMHKRAIHISNKIDAAEARGHKLSDARRALYRAQCNCAYWHGLFGGVYLNYLRHALYANLIEADLAVDDAIYGKGKYARLDVQDIDLCGTDEAVLTSRDVSFMIKPNAGGSMIALDYRPKRFNLLNTFARRMEAYHHNADKGQESRDNSGVASIHDIGKDISAFAKHLIYDGRQRYSFIDHAFASEPDWQSIDDDQSSEIQSLRSIKFKITEKKSEHGSASVTMKGIFTAAGGAPVAVAKQAIINSDGRIAMRYRLECRDASARPQWFATEFNFTLLAGHADDRFYQWDGPKPRTCLMDERKVLTDVGRLEMVDRAFGFRIQLDTPAERMALAPVETVSQSEQGFDKLYQGSVVWMGIKPQWTKEGTAEFEIKVAIENV